MSDTLREQMEEKAGEAMDREMGQLRLTDTVLSRLARAALDAVGAVEVREALENAESGLATVLESGDWTMPDDTSFQLQGVLDDLRSALSAGSRE